MPGYYTHTRTVHSDLCVCEAPQRMVARLLRVGHLVQELSCQLSALKLWFGLVSLHQIPASWKRVGRRVADAKEEPPSAMQIALHQALLLTN